MKNNGYHIFTKHSISIFSITALLMCAFSFSGANKKEVVTDAYSINTLPTTIDLNDTQESDIRDYYSALNSLADSERQGTNLLKNLKEILRNGQKYYSYDNNNGLPIWQIYEIADRDWVKSPASSVTYGTYDSTNNRLVNYQYGTSNSNSKNNPYLHALYVNRNVDNQVKAWGDHSQTSGWGINREHIWAKSHGFNATDTSEDSAGARGDPMHLWSASGYINATSINSKLRYHANYFFGFVDLNQTYLSTDNDGSGYSFLSGNYEGVPLNVSQINGNNVFEPQDSDKGDIARAIFYMAARYNYYSGYDEEEINSNNPNLELVDAAWNTDYSGSYDSTEIKPGRMGVLRDLLAWNRLDPPDEWEIHRNNLLYTNYTNNRNPFIDYPEWAEYIWGKSVLANDNRTITSYNSSPTGIASPSTDKVGAFEEIVHPTSISFTSVPSSLEVGDTYQLEYQISPNNASDKRAYFSSSDDAIVSISDTGLLTAVGAGEVSVSVTTVDGDISDSFNIVVSEQTHDSNYYLTSGSPYINGVPYKMYFHHTLGSADPVNYYFIGSMNGYYGDSSTDISQACDVYFEANGSGQNIYFESGKPAVKNYLYVSVSTLETKTYYNFAYSSTSIPSVPWIYNSEYKCMTYDPGNRPSTFGTYNQYTNFAAPYLSNTLNAMEFVTSDSDSGTNNSATGLVTLFTDYITCDETGENAPSYKVGASWDIFETLYSKYSDSAKSLLAETISSVSGTDLQIGLAKYDYIIQKYNTLEVTTYKDFLGRVDSNQITLNASSNSGSLAIDLGNSSYLTIIIAVGVSLASALILLITFKKKRKQ